jgi:hypothetical protein
MVRARAALGGALEYARVFEWSQGCIHAHLLLRVAGRIPRGLVKRTLDKVRAGGYRVSCKKVRSVGGMARYFVKHLKDRKKKAELTPEGFPGRVFQASLRFLTKSYSSLWREIQAERQGHTPKWRKCQLGWGSELRTPAASRSMSLRSTGAAREETKVTATDIAWAIHTRIPS